MQDLTHFTEDGRAHMVEVGGKEVTKREAKARASVWLNEACFARLQAKEAPKGDVLGVAQVAGIMAAKHCSDLIPLCHPLFITGAEIDFKLDEEDQRVDIYATVRCSGKTGVEMEALTAASVAALTIYDMLKAIQKDIKIGEIYLLEKSGGKSGLYQKEEERHA